MSEPVRDPSPPSEPAPRAAELEARPVQGTTPSVYRMHVQLSGVYVETEEELPEGAIVSVLISLPRQRQELKTVARVSYRLDARRAQALSRGAGVGLELLDVWGRDASDTVEATLEQAGDDRLHGPQNEMPEDVLVGAKVLIVDDDDSYRERAADGMREAGCRVVLARNGVEGLSLALRETPDLIISDVTMPGLDGWQLLRLLRTKNNLRNTPVIFLTTLKDETDRLRGYRLGVDDYLAKPFTAEELRVRARRTVERVALSLSSGGLRGKLSDVPLATVLNLAELERKTGTLELAREGERATLYIRDGRVCRIQLDPRFDQLRGIERFFHVLNWQAGRFELAVGEVEVGDELDLNTSYVLIEHARRSDEGAQDAQD